MCRNVHFSCYMLAYFLLIKEVTDSEYNTVRKFENIFVGSCLSWCLDLCHRVCSICTISRRKMRRDGQNFRITKHLQTNIKISTIESTWP